MNEYRVRKCLRSNILKKKKAVLIDVPERLIALDGGWSGERKVEEKMKNKFWEREQRALHTEKNSQSFGGTT